jgi:hypothetical protein
VISFCLLTAAMLGQVVTTDPGWFGRWLRGGDIAAASDVRPDQQAATPGSDDPDPQPSG